ncbi:hypothetical protein N7455_001761 [Penicillium solitum]|uniref:uncharacterized protein n=1 Tax=Penicillium solitum TaxID=60172 RepID=UPI0032C42828|nr:hypothetical protein N7536_005745 [Penicillium majusculum]KAJ5878296.1 hypothetical protein N7455_001761 [Penicillium solitum]KAJ5957292.1 hypothetical protein N7501_011571 [Penicillium viridicatum]
MPIGSCHGKPTPTHITNNTEWPEALSLYGGKSNTFCESVVALMPDLLIAQTIKSNQKLFVTRSAVELYWWLSYATYLPKVISINGLKQFSWLRRVVQHKYQSRVGLKKLDRHL